MVYYHALRDFYPLFLMKSFLKFGKTKFISVQTLHSFYVNGKSLQNTSSILFAYKYLKNTFILDSKKYFLFLDKAPKSRILWQVRGLSMIYFHILTKIEF